MASRKEYEMLFRLNAQTAGFRQEFQQAQKELQSMRGAIQDLNRIQGDISAYQKQQKAIEATTAKLTNLKEQQKFLQTEIKEAKQAGESTAALEREQLKLTQRIDDTKNALDRQNRKLNETGERLRNAGVDTASLAQEDAQLTRTIQTLEAEQREAAQSAQELADAQQDFGVSGAAAWDAVASAIAAAGITAALHELGEAYMECISITGVFEDSMANVAALSGASAQEMAQLGDMAKELGATTKFTATESADAMGYMAMAGWDAQQMLSGLPGILQLAAASGEDLATVSDIVTDSLTAFGLTAADSAHYSDVLAAAATSANTNVSMMGETFKYAAPMAGALGYAAEDVAVAVGMMANAGIKGSQAGTSLNNIFTRLVKPTKESTDAMNALGISLLDGSGHMYTFMELMEIMRDRFAGLTETQKAFYAAELAGQRGMSGLLSIVNASESDFVKLSEAIGDCEGAASRMAAIKLDTMNGQLTLAKSAADALKTTVGEQFTPMLKNLYSESANVMTEVNAFLQANPGLIKGVTAVAVGIGTMTAGITGFVAVTKIAVPLMAAFTSAIPGVGLIMGIGTALTALTAGMVLFRNEFDDTTYTAREQRAELEQLQAEYRDACGTFGETSEEASALRYQMKALNAVIESGPGSIREMTQEHEDLIASVRKSAAEYQSFIAGINDEKLDGSALARELNRLAGAYTGTAGEAELMGRIIRELNGYYDDLGLTLDDVISGTDDWKNSLDTYIREAAEAQKRTADLDRMIQLVNERGKLELDAQNYQNEIDATIEKIKTLQALQANAPRGYNGSTVYDLDLSSAMSHLGDYQQKLADTKTELEANEAEYQKLNGEIKGYADVLDAAASADQNFQNVIDMTTTRLEGLQEDYQELYKSAYESVTKQYNLWDEAAEVIPKSVSEMTKAMQSQIDYWRKYRENLDYLREVAPDVEGFSDMLAELAASGPTQENVNIVMGLAQQCKTSGGDIKSAVGSAVEAWQNLKTEQNLVSESMATMAGNFGEQMNNMALSVEDAVRNMNKDTLAVASAQATMQAFVDKIAEYEGPAQTAANRVAMAAVNQLNRALNSVGVSASVNGTTVSVRSSGGNTAQWTKSSGGRYAKGAYATGTDYARKGLALVGEYGPELVYFNGGESVITAAKTRAMLREMAFLKELLPDYAAGTASKNPPLITVISPAIPAVKTPDALPIAAPRNAAGNAGGSFAFAPVYHITVTGNADSAQLEQVLQKHDETLRRQMDSWWEDKMIDAERRGFY